MKICACFMALTWIFSFQFSVAMASEKQFQGFNDKQLKDLAVWTNHWCRGMYIKDERELDYLCGLRNDSWDALGKRGYCYDKWGKEMFPKCSKGGEPL